MKRILALLLVLCLLLPAGCAQEDPAATGTPTAPPTSAPAETHGPTDPTQPDNSTQPTAPTAQIRVLETDPVRQPVWQALAEEYTALTGVPVTIVTSEAAPLSLESEPVPTIFTIRSQSEAESYGDYCLNLSGQPVCTQLLSGNFALRNGDKVLGIAAQTEFFGLVYNTSLLARAAYTRADIQSIESLRTIAADITANRDALGFAAFACPDLSSTDIDSFSALFGSVPADLQEFWNIYVENAACSRQDIAARTTSGGLEELLRGEAVFYLAGAGDYQKFRALQDHEIAMLPIFFESTNQQTQGLCAVDTSYWCVHASALEADQQAALELLTWLVTPRADGTVPVDDFGVLAPYRQAVFAANPLEAAARTELLEGKQAVICTRFGGSVEALAQALAAYAGTPTDQNWAAVTQALKV